MTCGGESSAVVVAVSEQDQLPNTGIGISAYIALAAALLARGVMFLRGGGHGRQAGQLQR